MLKAVTLAVMTALVLAAVATGYLLYKTGEELEEEKSNRGRIPEEYKNHLMSKFTKVE